MRGAWPILLALLPMAAQAEERPAFLRYAQKPHRAGDWILQCESGGICRIVGIVRARGAEANVRALVMIERGDAQGAQPAVRFAFVDGIGNAAPVAPDTGWHMRPRGLHGIAPVALGVGAAPDGDGSFGLGARQSEAMLRALLRWPDTELRDRHRRVSRLPQGDLARLFRVMDDIQHPRRGLTTAERSRWLRTYHFTIRRPQRADDVAAPESILLACDTRPYTIAQQAWRLEPTTLLWIVDCPEGAKLFTQRGAADPKAAPITDDHGRVQALTTARIDPETALIEVAMLKNGRFDCGRRLRFGHIGDQRFGMIEDRQMPLCRGIAPAYWPRVWAPNSWRLTD